MILSVCPLSKTIYFGLTFAGLQPFKPLVLHISVASSSAVLVPSTAGCATTDSAGFLERATLGARPLICGR